MQPAECLGDPAPVGIRLGRLTLQIGHHDQTVDEVPAVRGRDRDRDRHPFAVEVSQQLDLPRQIGVAAPTEPSNRELPADAHAPHLVGDTGLVPLDTSHVVTPPIERLPTHGASSLT
jgi:hypothetical protein